MARLFIAAQAIFGPPGILKREGLFASNRYRNLEIFTAPTKVFYCIVFKYLYLYTYIISQ